MKNMQGGRMHMVTFALIVAGGILWLLEGLFRWNLTELFVGGQFGWVDRAIYVIVGIATIYEFMTHKTNCKTCEAMMKKTTPPSQ